MKIVLKNVVKIVKVSLSRCSLYWALLLFFVLSFSNAKQSYAQGYDLHSLGVRARLSEKTVLGKDAPERFKEYSVSGNFVLPWEAYNDSGWGVGSRVMASGGLLRGVGKNALLVSLVPELVFGSQDGRFIFDMGAGAALFSRYKFGSQDYGGPFQFALTLGLGIPVYERFGVVYRFQHYSDAGLNGDDTIGADFHMLELNYRL